MQQNVDVETKGNMAIPMTVPVDLLACPRCKGSLTAQEIKGQPYLNCAACKLAYPIKEGIPLMLQDEAVAL